MSHIAHLNIEGWHDLEDLQIYLRDRQAAIQRTAHGRTLEEEVRQIQNWREILIHMLKEATTDGLQLGGDL